MAILEQLGAPANLRILENLVNPSFERSSECLEKVDLNVMEPRMRLRTGDSTKKWSYLALTGTDAFEVRTYLDRVCWNGMYCGCTQEMWVCITCYIVVRRRRRFQLRECFFRDVGNYLIESSTDETCSLCTHVHHMFNALRFPRQYTLSDRILNMNRVTDTTREALRLVLQFIISFIRRLDGRVPGTDCVDCAMRFAAQRFE